MMVLYGRQHEGPQVDLAAPRWLTKVGMSTAHGRLGDVIVRPAPSSAVIPRSDLLGRPDQHALAAGRDFRDDQFGEPARSRT